MSLEEMRSLIQSWYDRTTPEERLAHFEIQKKTWVNSEKLWGDEGTRIVQ